MKRLFIDDERIPHDGWKWAKTAEKAIDLLKKNYYEIVSFDHDLGCRDGNTGYDVLCWIENEIYTNLEYKPPKHILIHTANSSVMMKMYQTGKSIERQWSRTSVDFMKCDTGWWTNDQNQDWKNWLKIYE